MTNCAITIVVVKMRQISAIASRNNIMSYLGYYLPIVLSTQQTELVAYLPYVVGHMPRHAIVAVIITFISMQF